MTLDSKDLREIREIMQKELGDLKHDVANEIVQDKRFRELFDRVEKIENHVDTEINELKVVLEKILGHLLSR